MQHQVDINRLSWVQEPGSNEEDLDPPLPPPESTGECDKIKVYDVKLAM